ncbi:MAG: hypothetical protein EOP83_33260 [Verrucomicrobiaceae bacterium]|nr:MAG: hypothetical protein EOP83_33260 [Verrucomicrobiaceae bacterium]
MSNAKKIATYEAANVAELFEALYKLVQECGAHPSTIYLTDAEQNPIRIKLFENTLTDGSNTYDATVTSIDG